MTAMKRFRIPVVAMSALMMLGVVSPLRASGTTIDDAKQQASNLEAQIEQNGNEIDALSEKYNGAVLAYQDAQNGIEEAKTKLKQAQTQHDQLSSLVAARGAVLYQGAQDPSSLLPSTDIKSVNELGARTTYGAVATGNDEQLISNLVRSEQDLTFQRKQLDKKLAAAAKERDQIAANRESVEQANSRAQELLSQVKGQIATLDPAAAGAGGGRTAGGTREPLGERIESGQRGNAPSRPPMSAATRYRVSRRLRPRQRSRLRTPKRNSASRTSTRRADPTPSTAPASR